MNFKKIVLILILFLINTVGKAQHSLSGKIIDADTHSDLENASVTIIDLHTSVQTDHLGNYQFQELPSASYEVQIILDGYKPISKTVVINGQTVANFELDKSSTEITEVVVTGSSKATQIRKSPLPIVTIGKDYLSTNLSTNIIDAISKVPGVSSVTTGPNVSKPYIRGLGANRILTLFDGVRQEEQQWGDEHGIEIDDYSINRIEIIKGPASLMYGSDALAGVVNLIPTTANSSRKISGSATTEYQSNNGLLGGSLFLSGTKNDVEYGFRVSKRLAKDYQNKIDGRVYNTGYSETAANAFVGVHKKWGFSHLNVSLYDNLQEIPDGSRDSISRKFTKPITELDDFRPIVSDSELHSYKIGVIHQRVQHYRAFLKNSFFFGNSRLDANFAFQKSWRREYSHPEFPYQNLAGLFLKLNTFNYDVKYFLPEVDHWNMTIGINGMYQKNNADSGTEFVIPSYKQLDFGGFFIIKKEFEKLNISGGLRYDHRQFRNQALFTKPNPNTGFEQAVDGDAILGADQIFQNYKTSFNGFTGSLGFSYAFTQTTAIKINFARGYRAPNVSEISASGVHPGTGYYQIGNDQFKPEFSNQIDLGITYSSPKINTSTSFFVNRIKNYIYNSRLQSASGKDSISVSGGQDYPTYKYQQGKVLLYGLEANIDFHLIDDLHFENSASLIFGDNKSFIGTQKNSNNRYAPQIPPFRYLSELRYDWLKNSRFFSKTFVKLQMQYTASQNRVYAYDNTETPTKGYTLFNIGLGTAVNNKKGKSIVEIYLLADNIFDTAFQNHLSRLKYFEHYSASPNGHFGIYNMGRNISLKLIKNF